MLKENTLTSKKKKQVSRYYFFFFYKFPPLQQESWPGRYILCPPVQYTAAFLKSTVVGLCLGGSNRPFPSLLLPVQPASPSPPLTTQLSLATFKAAASFIPSLSCFTTYLLHQTFPRLQRCSSVNPGWSSVTPWLVFLVDLVVIIELNQAKVWTRTSVRRKSEWEKEREDDTFLWQIS